MCVAGAAAAGTAVAEAGSGHVVMLQQHQLDKVGKALRREACNVILVVQYKDDYTPPAL